MDDRYNLYKHNRHSIRLKGYDYSRNGVYFVTICVKDREGLLSEIKCSSVILTKFGKIVEEAWLQIPKRFKNVRVDTFVIMPNHLHGIIIICDCINGNGGVGYVEMVRCIVGARLPRPYNKCQKNWINFTPHLGK